MQKYYKSFKRWLKKDAKILQKFEQMHGSNYTYFSLQVITQLKKGVPNDLLKKTKKVFKKARQKQEQMIDQLENLNKIMKLGKNLNKKRNRIWNVSAQDL